METASVLVAVYDRYTQAERAVRRLRRRGFAVSELAVLGGLAGAVDVERLCAFGAGLYDLGLSDRVVAECEWAVRDGRFLAIAHGPAERVQRAVRWIENTTPLACEVHGPPEPSRAAA